jgi:hypothetical protein
MEEHGDRAGLRTRVSRMEGDGRRSQVRLSPDQEGQEESGTPAVGGGCDGVDGSIGDLFEEQFRWG